MYNNASSGPVPLLLAVKRTQKTLHHLREPMRSVSGAKRGKTAGKRDVLEEETLFSVYWRG